MTHTSASEDGTTRTPSGTGRRERPGGSGGAGTGRGGERPPAAERPGPAGPPAVADPDQAAERIASGYYDRLAVLRALARRLLDSGDLRL